MARKKKRRWPTFLNAVRDAMWDASGDEDWFEPGYPTRKLFEREVTPVGVSGRVNAQRGEVAEVHLDQFPLPDGSTFWDSAQRNLRETGYPTAYFRELDAGDWIVWIASRDVEWEEDVGRGVNEKWVYRRR